MQGHRLIRILVHPGTHQTHYAVVARSVSSSGHVDRILVRGVLDDTESYTRVAPLLLALSDVLVEASRRLDV